MKRSHGGRRVGAGRPTEGEKPKQRKTYTLAPDVIARIEVLAIDTGHSKAAIIEYAIRTLKELPSNLD
jgi:hypothetical protein